MIDLNSFKPGDIAYIWVIYGKLDLWSTGIPDRFAINNYTRPGWTPGLSKVKIVEIYNSSSVLIELLDQQFAKRHGKIIVSNVALVRPCKLCKKIA